MLFRSTNYAGLPLFLGTGLPFGALPFISAPVHQVEPRSVSFGLDPEITGTQFQPFVYIDPVNPTNTVIQVVYLATSQTDTNLTTTVRFSPLTSGTVPIIEFATRNFDYSTSQLVTNSIYFSDSMLGKSNQTLIQNFAAQSFRPSNYTIDRTAPVRWPFAVPTNSSYANVIFYQLGYSNILATNA
mgnify:CR=1 FL=1